MWAILADPDRRGNRWDKDEFFATGETQVAECMTDLDAVLPGVPRGRALDFGCGAGRLTQALATHFKLVDGVDIAPSMVKLANQFNNDPDRVRFHLNQTDALAMFEDRSVDFILSLIVFQHMENRYKARYLSEFVRMLSTGGVAMVTIPSHPRLSAAGAVYRLPNPMLNLYRRLRYKNGGVMELHGMRRDDVTRAVIEAGGTVIDIAPDSLAGTPWHSFRYIIGPAA